MVSGCDEISSAVSEAPLLSETSFVIVTLTPVSVGNLAVGVCFVCIGTQFEDERGSVCSLALWCGVLRAPVYAGQMLQG